MKTWITFIIHIEGPIMNYEVLLEQQRYRCWAGRTYMYHWPLNVFNSKLDVSFIGGFAFTHIQEPNTHVEIFPGHR